MTADRPTCRPRAGTRGRRLLIFLAALAAPALLAVAPAQAATAATDATTAAAAAAACRPDDATACVAVLVLGAENARVPDAQATITGPGGFTADVTTAADAVAAVAVPQPGTYTVELDPATLPDDAPLPDGAATTVEVTAQTGSTARAAFRVGEAAAAPAPSATASGLASGSGSGSGSGSASSAAPGGTAADDAGGAASEGDAATGSITPAQVWQQLGSGLRFGLLLALASVGLSLIYGTTGLSSFSHGEQVTLGALMAFVTINAWGLHPVLGGIVTVAVCAATGWLQDAGIWRPLRRRGTPLTQLMIVTIGLSITLQFLIQLVIGGGSQRILTSNPRPVTVGPFTLTEASWWAMGIALVVILGIAAFLTRTRIGRATRAVSDNPALASATGIDPHRIVRIVWVMSAGLAGLAGMLLGIVFGSFNWMMGMQMLLLMFAATTLGGLGTAYGALVGSIVIGLVVELSNLVLPSDLRYASALVILILVLLVRPQGILGRRERIG
ncbi:branched-chain amino acid ABC transporter permease [Puerhibacterium puerhi]|uniref:branched-chain amino acid ABC transporter permease n=1 Tax=Puerhibacterium puerhi TaxID=2692623 RepID=UPI00135B1051|nr:branched-chain amino acid ABC transporter permease [Puerhibacterium puerhi]